MSVASPSGSRQGKLEALKAAARQRIAAGRRNSPWAWSRRAAADYLLPDGRPVDALEHAYQVLGLEGATTSSPSTRSHHQQRSRCAPVRANSGWYGSRRTAEGVQDFMTSMGMSPTEVAVSEMWSRIIGAEASSADDNFFDLGGSSNHLMAFLDEVLTVFGVELDLFDLFTGSFTVADHARVIDRARSEKGSVPL